MVIVPSLAHGDVVFLCYFPVCALAGNIRKYKRIIALFAWPAIFCDCFMVWDRLAAIAMAVWSWVSGGEVVKMWSTIPYNTVPYHTITYNTISYHNIPYHVITYHSMVMVTYYTRPLGENVVYHMQEARPIVSREWFTRWKMYISAWAITPDPYYCMSAEDLCDYRGYKQCLKSVVNDRWHFRCKYVGCKSSEFSSIAPTPCSTVHTPTLSLEGEQALGFRPVAT